MCVCFFFPGGGGILKLLNLDSLSNFIFGGGYSETLELGLSVKFHFQGGILKLLNLDSLSNFIFGGGGILKLLNLDSLSNFIFGGGGILNFRIGVFCRIWTKISTTPAGSCITDSLSHTTYVETNDYIRGNTRLLRSIRSVRSLKSFKFKLPDDE